MACKDGQLSPLKEMENSSPTSKSVWKFHSEDQKKRKHSSEDQKLSFSLELCSDDEQPSDKSTQSGTRFSACESTPKKKKTEEIDKDLMSQVVNDMEEEIERQLDSKAEKINLTVTNVKNILKSVITNEDVMAMVRQSLHDQNEGLDAKCIYEPKLTRAKAKELLKSQPLPSNFWPITPVKHSPAKSECHVLIQQELPEDSSDEEYNPNEDDQSDDDDEKNASSVASDVDSSPATPVSSAANISIDEGSTVWSQDGMFKIPPENIGQRTRSKLCLSDTPLETIEQAFIPPDITTDMYEWGCDNDDWKNFLQEFSKPLDSEPAVVDDPEEDPEYNVLADEEEEIVDKEELRMDRAVKVSRKELNELMSELFEYTENVMHHTSDDEDESSKSDKPEVDSGTTSNGPNSQCPTARGNIIQDQSNIHQQISSLPVLLGNPSCSGISTTLACFSQSHVITPLRTISYADTSKTLQTLSNPDSHQKENCVTREKPIESAGFKKFPIPIRTPALSAPINVTIAPTINRVPYTPNNKILSGRNAFSPLDLNELCNSSDAFLSIDKERTPAKVPAEEVKVEPNKGQEENATAMEEEMEELWSSEQVLLLNQQMRQHVQLTTQHFLQCYQHPELSAFAEQCKDMLTSIENESKENIEKHSAYHAMNLKSALKVVKAWESLFQVPAVEKSIKSFVEKMYWLHVGKKRKIRRDEVPDDLLFPPPLLEVVCASKAFIYPLLLPPVPFFKRGSILARKVLCETEERLVVYGIDTYSELVKETESKFSVKEREWDMLPHIVKNVVPTTDVVSLKNLILRRRFCRDTNPIKEYYRLHKLPHLVHYVIPVEECKTLFQQPVDLLPGLWRNFVRLKQRKAAKKAS